MKKVTWLFAAIAGLASCDSDNPSNPDGPPDPTPDTPAGYVPPAPFVVSQSTTGPDQLQAATAAPDGKFYVAGFSAAAVTAPRFVFVAKVSADGRLDSTFGTNGVFTSNVDFRGGNDELDITTQGDKIIVSATVANATTPADRDIAVFRVTASGTLDTTFGQGGVRIVDLNTAAVTGTPPNTTLVGLDSARSISIDGDGRIYLHAASRALARNDTEFSVARLTAEGALDTTYATGGKYLLDIAMKNATPRAIHAFADGSVIASGYASDTGFGLNPQPVLYKLTPAGVPDATWANAGLFHELVLAGQTEVYNFAIHGEYLVTAGYGRATGDTNDYVSMRFNVATGARDLTWGGTANGVVIVDPSGTKLGSNCRSAVALPGGRTALIGSTGPNNMPTQDAVVVLLGANGQVDTAVHGDGIHTYQLGANGNDQFWGAAVSGNTAIFVGYKGGGAMQTASTNDDGYAVLFKF